MRVQANPPIQQQIPADSLVVGALDGLRNVVRPERLLPSELEIAVNIDLDDRGQPSQRVGRVKLAGGVWGSAFNADDGTLICVRDGQMGRLAEDIVFHPLGVAVGDEPVCYCQVGPTIYWSTPVRNGKIDVASWTASKWGVDEQWLSLAPDSPNLGAVAGRLVGPPPPCVSMCWNGGRIFLASGSKVWFTDLFNYEMVDKTKNYWPFEGDVVWVGSTTKDIYVGTIEGVWYVGGGTVNPVRKRVMDGAAVPGSLVTIPSELGNPIALKRKPDQESAISLAFMTTHGYCVAYDDGNAFNLTEAEFLFPSATGAAAMFRQQHGVNQYVVDLKGSGQPTSRAAFGAYAYADVTPLVWSGDGSTIGPRDLERVRSAALTSAHGAIAYDDPGQITPYAAGVEFPMTHLSPSLVSDDLKDVVVGWTGGLLRGPENATALVKVKLTVEPNATRSELALRIGGRSALRVVEPRVPTDPTMVEFALDVTLDPLGAPIHLTASAPGVLKSVRVAIHPLTN